MKSEAVLPWLFAAVWFFLIKLLFSHLESKHPGKYDQMGRPELLSNNNFATNWATLKFLVGREHRDLNDRYASMLSDAMLAFLAVYVVLFIYLSVLIGG
jgi:hypothetical protein